MALWTIRRVPGNHRTRGTGSGPHRRVVQVMAVTGGTSGCTS